MNETHASSAEAPSLSAPTVVGSPVKKDAPKRIAPSGWRLWALLGFISLIAVAAVTQFLLVGKKQWYTLKVENAKPGSPVAGKPQGFPAADGAILLPYRKLPDPKVFEPTGREEDTAYGLARVVKDGTDVPPPPGMVFVKGGRFLMGSKGDQDNPRREVMVGGFYIDRDEVTNADYQKFCDATKHPYPKHSWDARYFTGKPGHPVVGINLEDAEAYVKWAGKRLPTDEEWEKAASWRPDATDLDEKFKRSYPWGLEPFKENANIEGRAGFLPVGQFLKDESAYGARSLAGNASEWVAGYFEPESGDRIFRGGNYKSPFDLALTTRRNRYQPQDLATLRIGFRCACSINECPRK